MTTKVETIYTCETVVNDIYDDSYWSFGPDFCTDYDDVKSDYDACDPKGDVYRYVREFGNLWCNKHKVGSSARLIERRIAYDDQYPLDDLCPYTVIDEKVLEEKQYTYCGNYLADHSDLYY